MRTIIIDNGAYLTRVGVSGYDAPEESFRTVVGRSKQGAEYAVLVGPHAMEKRQELDLTFPVDRYTMSSMDDMCHIMEYCCMDVLGCDSLEECPMLLTDGPVEQDVQTKTREDLAEVMFERQHVPFFYIAMQPFLSLISLAKTTGVVVDVGHSMSAVVPVVDGLVVRTGVRTTDTVSGRQLTDYLMKMLNERGDITLSDRDIVRDIKEKVGYVACDYEWGFKTAGCSNADYTLPDGKVIAVGTERFRCAEPLFLPSLLGEGTSGVGLQHMVLDSVASCEETARSDLYRAILATGGSTFLHNFSGRLKKEVSSLAGEGAEVLVLASPTRAWSAWLGGSMMAEWDGFEELAVSRAEYQEYGVGIMDKKCKN